jgi:hypothetical protein
MLKLEKNPTPRKYMVQHQTLHDRGGEKSNATWLIKKKKTTTTRAKGKEKRKKNGTNSEKEKQLATAPPSERPTNACRPEFALQQQSMPWHATGV